LPSAAIIDAVSTPVIALLAVVVFLACAQVGGRVYEHRVLDPAWPSRPALVQPQNGGLARRNFWTPTHAAFEVLLLVAVISTWSNAHVRTALLVAVASHAAVRVWSLADVDSKAMAFEKADPATVDRDAAARWTRRSLLRLPLDVVVCAATLGALIVAS
jgi:hypothetical protein